MKRKRKKTKKMNPIEKAVQKLLNQGSGKKKGGGKGKRENCNVCGGSGKTGSQKVRLID
jgi:hypothetical protein